MARLGRSQPVRPLLIRPRAAGAPSGTGTITGALTLSGTGVKHASGTGTITATGTLTGSGSKGGAGVGTITGTLTLSGSGTKGSGIGSIPRPRMRWQLIAGPAAGGHDLSLTEARSRVLTVRLTEPSEVRFAIDARHPQAEVIDELQTDIHVLWTSASGQTEILARCRVANTSDTIDANRHTIDVPALDYRAVLDRRRLYSTDTLGWTTTDIGEIAMGLVNQTQARTGGNLGISKGWSGTAPTGVVLDRTYEAGDAIGERIKELSEIPTGFDWDVLPSSPSALSLSVWAPERGASRGVVLEHGGLAQRVRREVVVAEFANAIRMTGEDTLTPQQLEADDLADRPEGRWDAVFGDTGLLTQDALNDRAAWQLAQSQVVQPTYTVTLRRGSWDGPAHMWVGDTVRLVIMSGSRVIDTSVRIYEMSFPLGEDGQEEVELSLGGPKPDPYRKVALTDRRLRNLERR